MYKYDLLCQECGKKIGEISFPAEPSQEKLDSAKGGYVCEDCGINLI
jgi:DNA-directed RNA polymerase subunit RPC12/RpoP